MKTISVSAMVVMILAAVASAEVKTYSVQDFGTTADGKTNDAAAIQKAIDAAAEAGGGVVKFPKGEYASGALFLKSNITLELEAGAKLAGIADLKLYPKVTARWEGSDVECYGALINAKDDSKISIQGKGEIAGSGVGASKVPAGPRVIETIDCSNVKIQGVTITNKGRWTVHFQYCKDVELSDARIVTTGQNADGCDPDSCINVVIRHCYFSTGDDCIAIKSGRNQDGKRVGKPTENVLVEDCTFGKGHGAVAIGSEVSGDIRNVVMRNCKIDGTDRGLRIKTRPGRGGVVENIVFENLVMKNVGEAISVESTYLSNPGREPIAGAEGITTIRNIRMQDISIESAKRALMISGPVERPIEGLTLKNISFPAGMKLPVSNVNKLVVENVKAGDTDAVEMVAPK